MIKIPVTIEKEVSTQEFAELLKPKKNPEYKIFDVVDFEYVNKYFDKNNKIFLTGIVIGMSYNKNEESWSYEVRYIYPGNDKDTSVQIFRSWELQLHNDS